MPLAVLVVGMVAQVIVWRSIADRKLPFWPATTATFALLGMASFLAGDLACCRGTTLGGASAVGAASGLVLFGATRLVVDLATGHDVFRRAVAEVYRREEETDTVSVYVLTLAVVVPGEELFWRGLVLPELVGITSTTAGALLTWVAWVAVDAAWGSIPLLAGALIGGALWTAVAVWSGGVAAPVASHLVWTGLMILWPPRAARGNVPS
jgi:membrane protease YdiL (CAAX protease family)